MGWTFNLLAWFAKSALFALSFSAACAHARIPYDLTPVAPLSAPVHPMRIAILPLEDARGMDDGPDSAAGFIYRGVALIHTDLGELAGAPLEQIASLVGRHLARSGLFRQVILVQAPEQAPEADLIMRARVRRMRGYVEAEAPKKDSGRPENERTVLAEVVLSGIEIREARQPKRALVSLDAGWSIFEKRTSPGGEIDPWQVLGEALFSAVSTVVDELRGADLSGGFVVRDQVELPAAGVAQGAFGSLPSSPPEGWRFVKTSTGSSPDGWKASADRCESARVEQKQTLRFHRVLGTYRPAVTLWACPADVRLSYDMLEEFPARYLGERGGLRYFALALGQSNWPKAIEQIARHLEVTEPKSRYIFELGARRRP